jgi:hypothetical protein
VCARSAHIIARLDKPRPSSAATRLNRSNNFSCCSGVTLFAVTSDKDRFSAVLLLSPELLLLLILYTCSVALILRGALLQIDLLAIPSRLS